MKLNSKQLGVIAVSMAIGFVINWLAWLAIMKHPNEISAMYHILVTLTLGSAFMYVLDAVTKAEIFK